MHAPNTGISISTKCPLSAVCIGEGSMLKSVKIVPAPIYELRPITLISTAAVWATDDASMNTVNDAPAPNGKKQSSQITHMGKLLLCVSVTLLPITHWVITQPGPMVTLSPIVTGP